MCKGALLAGVQKAPLCKGALLAGGKRLAPTEARAETCQRTPTEGLFKRMPTEGLHTQGGQKSSP